VRVPVFDHEDSVPNIASAKKNMRKTRAATVRNRAQRAALRTALKKANAAGSSPEAKLQAVKLLDRAARKGLIHRNAAGRYKSRLAKAS
jgi:small subunit ribosomal protein S20